MAFLELNYVAIPVMHEQWKFEPLVIGEDTRAFDGTLRRTERVYKRVWAGTTPVLARLDRRAVAGLVRGEGHVFSFVSDLLSSKGAPPVNTNGASLSSAQARWGTTSLQLAASTGYATWALGLGSAWTLMGWWYGNTAWVHYIATYDGSSVRRYVNGVRNDATTGAGWIVTIGGGAFSVQNTDTAVHYCDEVVALPYAIPDAWALGLYQCAFNSAFPPLPRLRAGGDSIIYSVGSFWGSTGSLVEVMGSVTSDDLTQGYSGGVFSSDMGAVQFTLSEA